MNSSAIGTTAAAEPTSARDIAVKAERSTWIDLAAAAWILVIISGYLYVLYKSADVIARKLAW